MKYRALADTGVFVSELCLGTMTFGGQGQIWETIGGLNQAEADALVGRALDQGINFIDTADVYGEGRSERLIGQLLKGDSDLLSNITHQVLATEIGTAREVVSRKLRRFESDGLIRSSRGRIEILDREKLGSLLGSPNT